MTSVFELRLMPNQIKLIQRSEGERMANRKISLSVLLLTICIPIFGQSPQMEKRPMSLYDVATFASQYPQIGKPAPDLEMHDLEGRLVKLSSFAGKTVILTKAGYT